MNISELVLTLILKGSKIEGKAGAEIRGGLTLANIILIGANLEGGLKLEALARAWGIKDVNSNNLNTLESICAKGALGYYVQAGLEASIIHADIFLSRNR